MDLGFKEKRKGHWAKNGLAQTDGHGCWILLLIQIDLFDNTAPSFKLQIFLG